MYVIVKSLCAALYLFSGTTKTFRVCVAEHMKLDLYWNDAVEPYAVWSEYLSVIRAELEQVAACFGSYFNWMFYDPSIALLFATTDLNTKASCTTLE
jgi:hypothetical protein